MSNPTPTSEAAAEKPTDAAAEFSDDLLREIFLRYLISIRAAQAVQHTPEDVKEAQKWVRLFGQLQSKIDVTPRLVKMGLMTVEGEHGCWIPTQMCETLIADSSE